MAMEYFPCYHSYRKKCEKLTDQELGRLFRALMSFSETGEAQELAGRESIAFDFIADDISRAQEAYEEKCRTNRKNGALSTGRTVADGTERGRSVANGSGRGRTVANAPQTKDKSKDKEKTKDKVVSPGGDTTARARDPAAVAQAAYMDRINPTPSARTLAELKGFAETMGAECVLRAIDIALDAGIAKWEYIRAILRSKQVDGVRSLSDWDALEAAWQSRKQDQSARRQPASSSEYDELMRIAKGG